jgi:hypothetical protein
MVLQILAVVAVDLEMLTAALLAAVVAQVL